MEQKLRILPQVSLINSPFDQDILQFIHTPKTAGTNIDNLLKMLALHQGFEYREFYDSCIPGNIISIPLNCTSGLKALISNYGNDPWDVGHSVRVVLGHMPVPSGSFSNATVGYFSIVRDPIDRLISLGNFLYQRNLIDLSDIEDFILNIEADNLQTRMLAGEPYMSGACTEETYQAALNNIKTKFAFVAPIEDLETAMAILAENFGYPHIAYAKTQIGGCKIITKSRTDLVQKLSEKNLFDTRLHEFSLSYWSDWLAQRARRQNHDRSNASFLVLSPHLYEGESYTLQLKTLKDIEETQTMGITYLRQTR